MVRCEFGVYLRVGGSASRLVTFRVYSLGIRSTLYLEESLMMLVQDRAVVSAYLHDVDRDCGDISEADKQLTGCGNNVPILEVVVFADYKAVDLDVIGRIRVGFDPVVSNQ